MDKEAVLAADLERNLPNRLQKRLRLDVADGAADFGYDDVGAGLRPDAVDELLYLVGDVRNDLYGRAEIFAPPLFIQDIPIDLAGREV